MNNHESMLNLLESHPVIAAVRNETGLTEALTAPVAVIFLLHTSLQNIKDQISLIQAAGKLAFVHTDMVAGLSKDQSALEYLAAEIHPAGVIITKTNLVQPAKSLGLLTVQRLFMLDSQSIETGLKMVQGNHTDFIEIMPGIIPKVIPGIRKNCPIPLIAGGMISTKEEIIEMLKAGVEAVSTSHNQLWSL